MLPALTKKWKEPYSHKCFSKSQSPLDNFLLENEMLIFISFNLPILKLTTYMKNFSKIDGMTNDFALSIFEDKNGELWFGMADGSIYTLNGQTFEKQF